MRRFANKADLEQPGGMAGTADFDDQDDTELLPFVPCPTAYTQDDHDGATYGLVDGKGI